MRPPREIASARKKRLAIGPILVEKVGPFFDFMAVFFDPCIFMAVRCFLHVSVEPIRWVVVRPYLHYILWEEMISIRYTAQRAVYDRAGFCTGDIVVWTNSAVWIPADQAKVHSILDRILRTIRHQSRL